MKRCLEFAVIWTEKENGFGLGALPKPFFVLFGGLHWNRTNNLLIKSQLLCLVELAAPMPLTKATVAMSTSFAWPCQFLFRLNRNP